MKIDVGKILLAIFFIIFLFIGPATLFNYKIKHDFPYGYLASDAFQHQIRTEAIKEAGNFRYEAFYISLGFKDTIGRYPPMIYHLATMFSYSAGIETYDSVYFIVFFFAIVGILIIYLIIKDFNRHVALISLPLAIIAFTHPLYIGFLWGHWPSLLSQSFLIAFAWCISKTNLKKAYIFTAIILSSIIVTHTSEAIFALIFTGLFLGLKLFSKKLEKNQVKNIFISFIIAFILALYYLIIFQNTWAKSQPYSFVIEPVWQGNPGFYLREFGLLLIFILFGLMFSLFRLKYMHTSLIFAFTMLISGFLNYIGFGVRSFQLRFFWPIYLSAFFGFGVYMLLKLVIKKWNMVYTSILCMFFVVLLIGIIKMPLIPQYTKFTSQGIMDIYHWDALKWLSKNTETDSKIYFFYGDIYSQDALLRNSKRFHYQVDPDDFIRALQERKIKKYYISELPGDSGGRIAVRKGLFSFEDPARGPQENFFGTQDICKFNYLIFDKVSRQPVLAQYNLIIASDLLKKGYITISFENEATLILKNNQPGADCIEERNF